MKHEDVSGDQLAELAGAVSSYETFCSFLEVLLANYRCRPSEWENDTLGAYLEGLHGFASSMGGYYQHIGVNFDGQNPSWRHMADALTAAKIYE